MENQNIDSQRRSSKFGKFSSRQSQHSFRNGSNFIENITSSSKTPNPESKRYIDSILIIIFSWDNLAHFIIIISAVLCFVPNMMGYNILIKLNPDNLNSLSDLNYNNALVASIAVTTILLLENILDSIITYKYFHADSNDETSEQTEITYFKFPTEILLLILAKDLIFLTYIIPNQTYDMLIVCVIAVDILFIWSYLYNLYRLGSSVWTLPKIFGIMFLAAAAEVAFVWMGMSETDSNKDSLLIFFQILAVIALFSFWYVTAQWFWYVWSLDLETVELAEYLKAVQASAFVVFLNVYILADSLTGFLDSILPPEWKTLGVSYIVMITYLMSIGTVCVSLITGRVSKFGSLAYSKKLLGFRKMFLRYISHEIRTPLNTVFLGLNLLRKELLKAFKSNPNHLCFSTIKDTQMSFEIAVSILNDMLLYDKVESGLLQLETKPISPWLFIKNSIKPFFIQARESSVNILIEMRTANSECVINIDPHQLSQVVRNLVSNALKFTNKPGLVKVVVDIVPASMFSSMSSKKATKHRKVNVRKVAPDSSKSLHFLRLTVSDFGAGISEENQAKLFKGIIQFNPGKLQDGKGTGLGLYISNGIVDMHKGHVWVESKGEGQGTTFSVILPVEPADNTMMLSPTAVTTDVNPDMPFGQLKDHILSFTSSKFTPIMVNNDHDKFSPNHVYHIQSEDAEYANLLPPQECTTELKQMSQNHADEEKSSSQVAKNLISGLSDRGIPESNTTNRVINLLIVDDSATCRNMIKKTLICTDGFKIRCDQAADGSKAVDLVRFNVQTFQQQIEEENELTDKLGIEDFELRTIPILPIGLTTVAKGMYEVILMDYQMPNMDGPTAIREIRSLGYKGKILGLTGNVLSNEMDIMRNAGADEVLSKPITPEVLDTLLQGFLSNTTSCYHFLSISQKRLPLCNSI